MEDKILMVFAIYRLANNKYHLSKRNTKKEVEEDVALNAGVIELLREVDENNREAREELNRELAEWMDEHGASGLYNSAN